MARVLEPLLWRHFNHTTVTGNVIEAEDIDLDLAANEAIMILGLDFTIHSEFTNALNDFRSVVIARPSAEASISVIIEAQEDPDFIADYHVNVAFLTSGSLISMHHRDWRPPEGGLIIARRMTWISENSQAAVRQSLNVWYKRLILDESEMIGLIIRRR